VTSSRSGAAAALLLAGLGWLAYANAFDAPFVFDDGVAIERNLQIRTLSPGVVLSPPRDTPVAGRPVVNATLALNHALGGLDPRGYRVANLAFHVACAWLLFELLRRSLRAHGVASPDAVALAAASVFVVHPLASECIGYVSQRSETLMALCLLLVLLGVARCAGAASHRERRNACALAIGACAVGMGTKESMAVAPLVAWLYDASCWSGSLREAWRRRRGLYLGLAATWLLLLALHAGAPRGRSVGFGHGVSVATYLAHQMQMLVTYLARAVWPHPLVLDYGWPLPLAWGDVLPEAALVLLWIALAGLLWWRRPALGFPLVAGLLVLAPSSSFVPIATEVGAERRFYLPLAGLIACAAACAGVALGAAPRAVRRAAVAGVALVVAVFALVTRARNHDYASPETLWRGVVAARPGQPRALLTLGQLLREQGRPDEAEPWIQAALRIHPSYALAEVQLAGLAQDRGDLAGAERHLRRALDLDPRDGEIRTNLGELLARSGRVEEAVAEWRAALSADASLAYAANNLAWVLATHPDARLRDGVEALALARSAALETHALDAGVLDTLAAAEAENGDFAAAVATASRALRRAEADGDAALARAIAARSEEYRQGRKVRWLPSGAGSAAPRAPGVSIVRSGA